MSQNTALTTATTTNYQPTWKEGVRLMLIKRIFLALLITGVIAISTAATQAQSTSRRTWSRGNSVNNPVATVPDQAAERAPVAEMQTGSQELQTAGQVALLDKKTAIVGSWQGTVGGGNRVVSTFNSDGTVQGSVQTEVSTIPELGVLTPTHGVWEYLGGRQFGLTVVGLIYDINTGADLGTLKARVLLTLNATGDQMSGTDKVEIFGPDGELVFTASGDTTYTASSSSRLIKRQPLLAQSRSDHPTTPMAADQVLFWSAAISACLCGEFTAASLRQAITQPNQQSADRNAMNPSGHPNCSNLSIGPPLVRG